MEWASKTVETSSQREVRRAKSTADQVGSVRANITTFVVRVDGEVQSHQFNEVLVLSETELVGQVVAVVLVFLDRCNLAILVDVAVDLGRDGWELSNEVHRVLKSVLPVLRLVHSLSVGLCEIRFMLESCHSERELGHGVKVVGAAVDELLDELGNIGTGSPLRREVANLLLRGNFASQEQPEETFRQRLLAAGGLGENLLTLWDLRYVSLQLNSNAYRSRIPSFRGIGCPPQSLGRNPSNCKLIYATRS